MATEEEEPATATTGATLTTSTPLVLDNGGGLLKAGLASTTTPFEVPTLAGSPKHARVMLQSPSTEKYFGGDAYKYRGLCKLTHPINRGIIDNWNDMIQLWQYLYSDVLEIKMKEHPVLITEVANNPISNKARIAQIYLEYFQVPSVYFIPPPVLSLYATGRLSGCVLDSGHGVTTCTPIIDGYVLPNAITRMDVGGKDITEYFSKILSKCGDYKFTTSAELQTVRLIKEQECVLDNFSPDTLRNPIYHSTGIKGIGSSGNLLSINKLAGLSGKLGGLGSNLILGSKSSSALNSNGRNDNSLQKILPDGKIINIGNTHQRAAEILFDPSLIGYDGSRGIHYNILNCIAKCDMKIRNRLYNSIYLVGGNCNIKNFRKRLEDELKRKIHSKKSKIIRVKSHIASNKGEKHLIPYIGGTLIASQSGFKDQWITLKEFNEFGISILYRKSLC